MSVMNEHEDPSRDRLKQHFAKRVIHQVRQVLEVWQRLQQEEWGASVMAELAETNLGLLRYAERFEQDLHIQLARGIGQCLETVEDNRGRLNSQLITELNQLMQRRRAPACAMATSTSRLSCRRCASRYTWPCRIRSAPSAWPSSWNSSA